MAHRLTRLFAAIGLFLPAAVACGASAQPDSGDAAPSPTSSPTGTTSPTGSVPPDVDGAAPDAGDGGAPSPSYDGVQAKASHNSYERDEPLFDQLVHHKVRALELDIHNGKRFQPSLANDFYVYHFDAPGFDGTSCTKLSDCIGALAAYHRAVPEHEVVTVFVDVKDDFEAFHSPDDLDAQLLKLGRSTLFTPADWLARCPGAASLRGAITPPCTMPKLDELRGKVVFALTGGTSCGAGAKLEAYVAGGAEKRLGFIAPETSQECSLAEYEANKKHVVFLNFEAGATATASEAARARYLTRVYNLNDSASFGRAKAAGAHFLGTNNVNAIEDPWATTASADGYPFTCLGGCPGRRELGDVLGLEARSGDLVGAADGVYFVHEPNVTDAVTWTAGISVASSHVDRGAEGCLMARASIDQGAPFFAVCRPADVDTVRVFRRETASANVATATASYPTDGIYSSESTFFARLTVTPQGAGSRVKGEGSVDGVRWVTIDERTFAVRLALQGVAATGKAAAPSRAFFAGLTRAASGSSAPGRSNLTATESIGQVTGRRVD